MHVQRSAQLDHWIAGGLHDVDGHCVSQPVVCKHVVVATGIGCAGPRLRGHLWPNGAVSLVFTSYIFAD